MTLTAVRLVLGSVLCGILALLSSPAQNQAPPTQAQNPIRQLPPNISDQTYRVSVDLINIFCSVWDRKTSNFITHLTQDDFIIFEDLRKSSTSPGKPTCP